MLWRSDMTQMPRRSIRHRLVLVIAALGFVACATERSTDPPAPPTDDAVEQFLEEQRPAGESGYAACGYKDVTNDFFTFGGWAYDICVLSWCSDVTCLDCASAVGYYDIHACAGNF